MPFHFSSAAAHAAYRLREATQVFRRHRPVDGPVLAVIDFQEHTRGGHFGPWLKWFASEFSRRFALALVVTPNPSATEALFREQNQRPPANLIFRRLPARLRTTFDLDALREIREARGVQLHAFIMWGYDLPALSPAQQPSAVPWATLSGVSWHLRGHSSRAAEAELQVLERLRASAACCGFLQPDGYVGGEYDQAIWIPDLESVALPGAPTDRETSIQAYRDGKFCVGCFGLLTGFRCLDEVLLLAREQPGLRFVLAGKIFPKSVDPALRPLLEPGATENILILPGFIEDDAHLNAAINAVDAVFIDGKNYPVQSGIVCRAVHFGKCLLTPQSDSWTNDFIQQWGVGIRYEARNGLLAGEWERWVQSGGPERSRSASAATRNAASVSACFDRITARLLSPQPGSLP